MYIEIKPVLTLNTIEEQFDKVADELDEAREAYFRQCEHYTGKNSIKQTGEEIIDTMTACMTLLIQLGFNDREIYRLSQDVIGKNANRGYYREFIKET